MRRAHSSSRYKTGWIRHECRPNATQTWMETWCSVPKHEPKYTKQFSQEELKKHKWLVRLNLSQARCPSVQVGSMAVCSCTVLNSGSNILYTPSTSFMPTAPPSVTSPPAPPLFQMLILAEGHVLAEHWFGQFLETCHHLSSSGPLEPRNCLKVHQEVCVNMPLGPIQVQQGPLLSSSSRIILPTLLAGFTMPPL